MYTSVSIYYSKFKNLVKRIIYLPKWSGHSGWGRSWTPLHRNPALVPLLVAGPISNGPTRSSHVYVYLSSLECSLYHPYLRSRYCSCSGFPWSGGKCSSFTGIGTQAYNWYIEECVLREVMKEPLHYQCLFVWQLRRTHTHTNHSNHGYQHLLYIDILCFLAIIWNKRSSLSTMDSNVGVSLKFSFGRLSPFLGLSMNGKPAFTNRNLMFYPDLICWEIWETSKMPSIIYCINVDCWVILWWTASLKDPNWSDGSTKYANPSGEVTSGGRP